MWIRSLGWEDPLEKERATHSRILAWEIPWTDEPGGLRSIGSQKSGTWHSDSKTTTTLRKVSNWLQSAKRHRADREATLSASSHTQWGRRVPAWVCVLGTLSREASRSRKQVHWAEQQVQQPPGARRLEAEVLWMKESPVVPAYQSVHKVLKQGGFTLVTASDPKEPGSNTHSRLGNPKHQMATWHRPQKVSPNGLKI